MKPKHHNQSATNSAGMLSFPAAASAMVMLLLGVAVEHEGYSFYLLLVTTVALVAIWGQFFTMKKLKTDHNA